MPQTELNHLLMVIFFLDLTFILQLKFGLKQYLDSLNSEFTKWLKIWVQSSILKYDSLHVRVNHVDSKGNQILIVLNLVKCSLKELTTKSASVAPWPVVSLCAHVPGFHIPRAYLTSLLHRPSQAFARKFLAPGKLSTCFFHQIFQIRAQGINTFSSKYSIEPSLYITHKYPAKPVSIHKLTNGCLWFLVGRIKIIFSYILDWLPLV